MKLSKKLLIINKNLSRSWESFSKNFFTVYFRVFHETPLLPANQNIYLRAII
ncbi:MAG: uroporphyrinogen-III C-methyltransferase [Arsenophonus sp. NC-PG7-MAG3]